MSFNPASIPSRAYIGNAQFSLPVAVCTPLDRNELPNAVRLDFAWASYGASLAVPSVGAFVDISVGSNRPPISKIRSVYINNTQSGASVYVYFPDTAQMVTCAPFATVNQPAMTNGLQVYVYARGLGTDDPSQTQVFLANVVLPPVSVPELNLTFPQFRASPNIARGIGAYSNGFAIPAIGDQWQSGAVAQPNGTTNVALFGAPYVGGGLITLTDIFLNIVQPGTSGDVSLKTVSISAPISGSLITFTDFTVAAFGSFQPGFLTLVQQTGLQYKLDAAEAWTLAFTCTSAQASIRLNYRFGYSYQGQATQSTFTFGNFLFAINDTLPTQSGDASAFAGIRFTAPSTASLINVEMIGSVNTLQNTAFQLALYTDNGGSPGQLISTSAVAVLTGAQLPVNFLFPDAPGLIRGTNYWLVTIGTAPYLATWNVLNNAASPYGSGRAATAAGLTAGAMPGGANQEWQFQATCRTL